MRPPASDGPDVVQGVFSIPLAPPAHDSARSPADRLVAGLQEFIAGSENRLASVAMERLLCHADTRYSPIVLYGPSGVGKSHLAEGLAAWWSRRHRGAVVVSASATRFAETFAAAVHAEKLPRWRQQMHAAQLLVLEDIEQLAGKRSTQQELCRVLDVLAAEHRQVIVTSRTLPHHRATLIPTLRSRLSAGLAVPLALPGKAARRQILERAAAASGIKMPRKVLHVLADGLSVPAPLLLKALKEVDASGPASASLTYLDQVRRYVASFGRGEPLTLRDIAMPTARYFGLTLAELKSPQRRQALVAARGVAIYLARQLTNLSLDQIGQYFGGRDHTTILHSYTRTERLAKRDASTRQAVAELRGQLEPAAK